MATPTPVTYSVAHGVICYGGKAKPASPLPLWLRGAPLNTVIAIPNTVSPITSADAWCGIVATPSGEVVDGLVGGHSDGYDNRVVKLNLMADVPAWTQIFAPTPNNQLQNDQPYYLNGDPASRHTYNSPQWSDYFNRALWVGCYAPMWTDSVGLTTFPTVDGLNIDTGIFDAPGTYLYAVNPANPYPGPTNGVYPSVTSYRGAFTDSNGDIWSEGGCAKWSIRAGTWAANPNVVSFPPPWPWAHNTDDDYHFALVYGDGYGYSGNLGANAVKQKSGVQTRITLTGPAIAQFAADFPTYPAMAWDPINKWFVFYDGIGSARGRFYKITPNNTNTWDISLLTEVAASVLPPTQNNGMNGRMRYVPALKGFIIYPGRQLGLYFYRVA